MHFSLIQPQPRTEREAAYERTRGAYEDHQWMWQRFFPAPSGTPRDFLFRRLDVGVAARFHVVSARPPCTDVPGWQVQTKPYDPRLSAGERLRFELRANPVISRPGEALLDAAGAPRQRVTGKRAGTARHKVIRHDVVMEAKRHLLAQRGLDRWQDWQDDDKPQLYDLAREACGQWLIQQGAMRGFEIDTEALQVDAYTQHRGKSDRLRFSSVDFAGELTVLDATSFGEALTRGIGHAKAFGCGLLLVRRLG
jgi:CRISPR system Cascade subunit CasE